MHLLIFNIYSKFFLANTSVNTLPTNTSVLILFFYLEIFFF